jgi:hypothetical protein
MAQERREWKTLYQMNRPVYIAGLKPFQWVIVFALSVFILFALVMGSSPVRFILLLLPYPLYLGVKKVSRENDSGHPDYLNTIFVWWQMNKHFIDSTKVFSKLKEKSERAGTKI